MRRIKLKVLLLAIYCSYGIAGFSQGANKADNRPNIIVILVDDMRWDEFSAVGHAYIKTPNIDRIAIEGASLKNAFVTTPLCSPSRASFFTGQYAYSHGITDNTDHSEHSHQLQTFPRKFQAQGYNTAFIGKWHMGNDDSQRPGFDYWVALRGQGEAIDPKLNINGDRLTITGYVTDILTDYSLKFIDQKRNSPFLLFLSHKALHPNLHQSDDGSITPVEGGGFIPAQRHTGMYADAVFKRRPNAYIPPTDKPALARKISNLAPLGPKTATKEAEIRARAEMLMAVDESLGNIYDALKEKGELDNTVIVFTSDHGYFYGEHGLSVERRLAYEETMRIPMLIRFPPEINAGITPEQMVLNIDLAPFLVELAGINSDNSMDGRSFLPVLKGQGTNWRSSFIIEYYSDHVFPRMVNMGYKAVRTEKYKYIQYADLNGMDELYDLDSDPYELKNIIQQPDANTILSEMKEELAKLLKQSE